MGLSTTVNVVISAALIVGQMILTDGNPLILWGNWMSAGMLAAAFWYAMGRFHLEGISEGKAMAIIWPLMSMTLNFAYLYFPIGYPYYHGLIQILTLMGFIVLSFSIWQARQATVRCIGLGFLLGLSSTIFPHTLLWLLLIPYIMFHMRATSSRNVFSILTGALLGVWMDYCVLFSMSPEEADGMLLHYLSIFQANHYVQMFLSLTLWQWLYIALMSTLLFIYSIVNMLLGTGHSMRSNASIMLLAGQSIAAIVFLSFDLKHTSLYVSQLSLFLGMLLTIHQSNSRSLANEWWTQFILFGCAIISILPLLYD